RQRRRERGLKTHGLARNGMFEAQNPCMKRLPRELANRCLDIIGEALPFGMSAGRSAIDGIAQERMPDRSQVHPDLMGATRLQTNFKPAGEGFCSSGAILLVSLVKRDRLTAASF